MKMALTGSSPLILILCLSACGHIPFKSSPYEKPIGIYYTLNFSGNQPQVEVVINTQKGSREFTLKPFSPSVASYPFWQSLRSSITIRSGSIDLSHPDHISLFCFPACHFTYVATSNPLGPFKIGDTLFPKIENVRKKRDFPITLTTHYHVPTIYTSYCMQARSCILDSDKSLSSQFTYWGPTFPGGESASGLDHFIFAHQSTAYDPDTLSTVQELLTRLHTTLKSHASVEQIRPMTFFVLPDATAQGMALSILKKERLILLTPAMLSSPALVVRAIIATFFDSNAFGRGSDAAIDALWLYVASDLYILSSTHRHQWIAINTWYARHRSSVYSTLALEFFEQLTSTGVLTPLSDMSTPSPPHGTHDQPDPLLTPIHPAYLVQTTDQMRYIIWSHPEIPSIIDESDLRPLLKRFAGPQVIRQNRKK